MNKLEKDYLKGVVDNSIIYNINKGLKYGDYLSVLDSVCKYVFGKEDELMKKYALPHLDSSSRESDLNECLRSLFFYADISTRATFDLLKLYGYFFEQNEVEKYH